MLLSNWIGNYLRVRGEYLRTVSSRSLILELPPRARRIRSPDNRNRPLPGTTSACAENTQAEMLLSNWIGNYLRVRGEYDAMRTTGATPLELPPRARRIPVDSAKAGHGWGTTSACAENTFVGLVLDGTIRNYLRVRGEYPPG